jgi:FkbH-like protein
MTVNPATEELRATIRALVADQRFDEAWRQVRPELEREQQSSLWTIAGNVLRAGAKHGWVPPTKRQIRLALLCTYEAAQLADAIRLACYVLGIDAELYAAPYGQLEQELFGTDTALAQFKPSHVLLAPSTADLAFPELAQDAEALLAGAERRWRALWEVIRRDHGARVIQHSFVVPDETPLGHLAMRVAASRPSLVRELDRRLAEHAGGDVLLVDCERIAAQIGKRQWEDPRLWYAARQPYGNEALAALALQTAAVLAGDLGLAARCLVVDLDNTLWGGVVGDDGVEAIVFAEGPEGEAYAAFQEYVSALHRRGLVLAVASKNDREAAREPFERRPGMRLKLDDFAMFVADWRRKPEQISEIASALELGLDAIVFADDNPAECAEVAAALPEVSVVCLDGPPSERVRALAASLRFETSALAQADIDRQRSYAARGKAAELRTGAATVEEFWRSLQMRARVRALEPASLDRAAQLTQKTNQFNLTLRRHTREDIERMLRSGAAICRTLELADRFTSHGMIGLAIAVASADDAFTALIDTLLLSCRVIGRTAEVHMLSHLTAAAIDVGFARMRGVYVPGPRNALVADLYPKLGFVATEGNRQCWEYDLASRGPIESAHITDEP